MPHTLTAVFADRLAPRFDPPDQLQELNDILVIAPRAVIAAADGQE